MITELTLGAVRSAGGLSIRQSMQWHDLFLSLPLSSLSSLSLSLSLSFLSHDISLYSVTVQPYPPLPGDALPVAGSSEVCREFFSIHFLTDLLLSAWVV